MSGSRIDLVSRELAQRGTRRTALRLLLALLAATFAAFRNRDSQSRATGNCSYGETLCNPYVASSRCADLSRDQDNCGACGNACPRGTICLKGRCDCDYLSGKSFCESLFGGICVDLESEQQNCGYCGNSCPIESECISGECVAIGVGDDSGSPTGSFPQRGPLPFGLEEITTDLLTEETFGELLPRKFPGYELIVELDSDPNEEPLFPGTIRSTTYLYLDPGDPEATTAVATANVSALPPTMSVVDFIYREKSYCARLETCATVQENEHELSRVIYQLQQFPSSYAGETAYFLVWGERTGELVFALIAMSAFGIENLALGLSNNARAATEAED